MWRELVRSLIAACEQSGLSPDEKEQLDGLEQAGYLDDVTDFCRDFLGEGEYRDFLSRVFAGREPSPTHQELVKLSVPAIMTTNYDPLLEQAFASEYGRIPTVLTSHDGNTLWRRFARNEFFILKVHGHIDRPDTIVLSSHDYAQHVFGNLAFMQFLQRLFATTSVLFVGTSLADPYIRRILEETMFLTEGVGMPHYAVLPLTGTVHARLLRDRFNIHVLAPSDWETVPALLAEIRQRAT
jgi:hypothetical protein